MTNFENMLQKIFTYLPDLPLRWREKLAKHTWIIVLIVSILGVLSVIVFVALLLYLRYAVGNFFLQTAYVQLLIPVFVVGTVLNLASIILLIWSVQPLKRMEKRGWNLVLYSLLLLFVAQILLPVVVVLYYFISHTITSPVVLLRMLAIPSLVWWVVIVGVLAYLLFQVRELYLKDNPKV